MISRSMMVDAKDIKKIQRILGIGGTVGSRLFEDAKSRVEDRVGYRIREQGAVATDSQSVRAN